MKQVRYFGVLIVATLAMSVVGVSSAVAAAVPTWVVKGSELSGSAAFKGTGGESKLYKAGKEEVKCTASSVTGEIEQKAGEAGKDKKTVVTYTGCESTGAIKVKVKSPGQAEGTIKTESLKSLLAFKPGTKEVVDALMPETGALFTTIEAAGGIVKIPVEGSVIGLFSPQAKPAVKGELIFSVTAGNEQLIPKFEAEEGSKVETEDTLEVKGEKGAYKGTESIELNSKEEVEARP